MSDQNRSEFEVKVHQLFSTPFLIYQWPDSRELNQELREIILKKKSEAPGVQVTNAGGWHSTKDLNKWEEPGVRNFVQRIDHAIHHIVSSTVSNPDERHFEGWSLEAWANVNGKGHFNVPHVHRLDNNLWSGVYYVDTGYPDDCTPSSGLTKFQDRSGVPKEILNNSNPFEREFTLNPKAGLMVFFPGALYHYVEPLEEDTERISIAFNLKHPGFTVPQYPGGNLPKQKSESGISKWMWHNFRGLMRAQQIIRGKSK